MEIYQCQNSASRSRASSSHQALRACIGMDEYRDGWMDRVLFETHKTMIFGNITKTTLYFYLIVFLLPLQDFLSNFFENLEKY